MGQYHIIININNTMWKRASKTVSCLSKSQLYCFSKIDKKPNLYGLLEVKPNATPKEISFNYYKLIRKYNPTSSPDPTGHAKLLNEAFVILSN